MKTKTVLIVGGAGFIGSNTARFFIESGWRVVIFDNFSRRGTEHNVRMLTADHAGKFKVVRGDIVTDIAKLNKAVKGVDAVIHLAAQVAATTSIEDPKADFLCNSLGTLHVLEAVRAAGHNPPVIFSSTNKVYGSLGQYKTREGKKRYEFSDPKLRAHGISESEQLDFHSPYRWSKGAADQYMLD